MIPLKKAVISIIDKSCFCLDTDEAPFYIYEDIAWRAFKGKITVFYKSQGSFEYIPSKYFKNHTFKKFNYFSEDVDETEMDFDPFIRKGHLDIESMVLDNGDKFISRTY